MSQKKMQRFKANEPSPMLWARATDMLRRSARGNDSEAAEAMFLHRCLGISQKRATQIVRDKEAK